MEWNFCNWDFVEDFPVDFVMCLYVARPNISL